MTGLENLSLVLRARIPTQKKQEKVGAGSDKLGPSDCFFG